MFKVLYAARADNSLDREFLKLISPSLLVIDDFGLERLTPEQAHDFYEIVSERYERGATIITSNRHVAEWVSLFDDQIIANSALDRLAHNAHQMIIEGESYRKRKKEKLGTLPGLLSFSSTRHYKMWEVSLVFFLVFFRIDLLQRQDV